MMKILPFLVSSTLFLLTSACGGDYAASEAEPPVSPEVQETVSAHVHDDVQVVEIEVGPQGYSPARIVLKAHIPARLIFTRTADGWCTDEVSIPAFEIEKTPLPLNEAVTIEFTPDETGEFTFVCGMDMFEGTILVRT